LPPRHSVGNLLQMGDFWAPTSSMRLRREGLR
jgi:hypothetical protein